LDRDHLVSTGLDLIPTLCDYAGIAAPEGLRGLSVRSIASGKPLDRWRDFVVSETEFDYDKTATGIYGRMVRTSRYKYIVYSEGTLREQLFDMETDPGEMRNLAIDARTKDILVDCRAKLAQWCRDTGDRFQLPQA
jgi:arylsulfatase A-like enzyme